MPTTMLSPLRVPVLYPSLISHANRLTSSTSILFLKQRDGLVPNSSPLPDHESTPPKRRTSATQSNGRRRLFSSGPSLPIAVSTHLNTFSSAFLWRQFSSIPAEAPPFPSPPNPSDNQNTPSGLPSSSHPPDPNRDIYQQLRQLGQTLRYVPFVPYLVSCRFVVLWDTEAFGTW